MVTFYGVRLSYKVTITAPLIDDFMAKYHAFIIRTGKTFYQSEFLFL